MARDRELLSDNELHRKILDIVEYITGTTIVLQDFARGNYIKNSEEEQSKYVMNICSPIEKHIDKMTAIGHECGHILAYSPIQSTANMINMWLKDETIERKREMYNEYWSVFNILEDERVESYIISIWRAYIRRFHNTKKNLGEDLKLSDKKISNMLLAIRFFRQDLVTSEDKKLLVDCIEKVKNTGKYGAVKLLIYLKPIIDKYFKKEDSSDITSNCTPFTNTENVIGDVPQYDDMFPASGDYSGNIYEDSEIIEEGWKESLDESDLSVDNIDSILAGEKEDFESDISEINSNMNIPSQPSLNRIYKNISRDVPYPEIPYNKIISNSMNKLFRKISEMKTDTIDQFGDEVDVETFIDNYVRGTDLNNCMINKKITNGLSILLSIDGSGSMKNSDKINEVRKLVLTLYKSIENIDGIYISANVWSSNNHGYVGITEINNINDIQKIQTVNSWGSTPTHLALEYSAQQISKMRGRKKLLIMITDGMPEYYIRGYHVPHKQLIKQCKKSLSYALRKTPNIVSILVGNSYSAQSVMKDIFGKSRFINCVNMDSVSENVIKQFKSMIIRTLR